MLIDMKTKFVVTYVRFPEPLYEALRRAAFEDRRSMRSITTDAVAAYLAERDERDGLAKQAS